MYWSCIRYKIYKMIHYEQILLRLPLASVLGLLFIIDWSHSCFINREFDHGLSRLLHDDLHWLDVPGRIQYKTGVTVHRCLQSKAPKYLTDCCILVSETASRRHLHSASRPHLSVPRHRLTTIGRRAFSVAGLELSTRQTLTPGSQQQLQATTQDGLVQPLLITLSAAEMLHDSVLYKFTIDIDISWLQSINQSCMYVCNGLFHTAACTYYDYYCLLFFSGNHSRSTP